MATKIKLILQKVPRNAVLFSSWLSKNGIDRKEQTSYVRSGWIERISQGIYKFAGETPTDTRFFRPITLSLIKGFILVLLQLSMCADIPIL